MYIRRVYNIMPASIKSAQRSQTINLRISRAQKTLIDEAASAVGRNRTEFMLDAASREAEAVLVDRRYFQLGREDFDRFVEALDKPPSSNPRLRRLLRSRAPWDK
jgi:uncharacterized protein (DUF1778 family)